MYGETIQMGNTWASNCPVEEFMEEKLDFPF